MRDLPSAHGLYYNLQLPFKFLPKLKMHIAKYAGYILSEFSQTEYTRIISIYDPTGFFVTLAVRTMIILDINRSNL